LREQTEWVELVKNDYNRLVGSDKNLLAEAFTYFKSKTSDFSLDLYGKGKAAEKAVEVIAEL
jgi:UDP-GlcNAc3NAcA epimerase